MRGEAGLFSACCSGDRWRSCLHGVIGFFGRQELRFDSTMPSYDTDGFFYDLYCPATLLAPSLNLYLSAVRSLGLIIKVSVYCRATADLQ